MRRIIIAIDGHSGSGKSSFARNIAARYGYIFVDTGAMYRAVTLYAMDRGLISADGTIDAAALVKELPKIHISFKFNESRGASDIYLGGENVEDRIRSIAVSGNVSGVSRIPEVREHLVRLQKEMGRNRGIVMDGRDIGTVVFPDAELKIFMTADPETRAERRFRELSMKGEKVSLREITDNIRKRDNADATREISPLKKAPDALLLDNSRMSMEQQMQWIAGKIDKLTK